jgi:hypothetical protein
MQPHFPGYPVYIYLASLMPWGDPVEKLTGLGAIFGGLLCLPVFFFTRTFFGETKALIACILVAVHPLMWLHSVQPYSDMVGTFFIWVMLAVIAYSEQTEKGDRKQVLLASVAAALFALAMGVRVSYFPFAFALLTFWWRLPKTAASFLFPAFFAFAFFLLWFVPLAAHEGGIVSFLALGFAFTQGHFTEWGGTVFSQEDSILSRFMTVIGKQLLLNGAFGAAEAVSVPTILVGAVLIVVWRMRMRPIPRLFLFVCIPYLLWVFIGQNVDKLRHILPLIPFVAVILAGGIIRYRRAAVLLLASLYLLQGAPQVYAYATQKPPVWQLAEYVAKHYDVSRTVIFTWEEERVIEYVDHRVQAMRVLHLQPFYRSVLNQGEQYTVLATNKVLNGFGKDGEAVRNYFTPVKRFRGSSFLYPVYSDIVLYEAKPDFYAFVRKQANR